MIAAYAKASARFERRAPLVLLGGFPGEFEGPHPLEVIEQTGARDVFLAGWRPHDQLGEGLNAGDALVLASAHEEFGQVVVEAMACGIPPIAANAHGPGEIVEDGETGWLVHARRRGRAGRRAGGGGERRRRARAPRRRPPSTEARAHYSWPAIAKDVAAVYDECAGVTLRPLPHPPLPARPRRAHQRLPRRGGGGRAPPLPGAGGRAVRAREERLDRAHPAPLRRVRAGVPAGAGRGRGRGAVPRRAARACGSASRPDAGART